MIKGSIKKNISRINYVLAALILFSWLMVTPVQAFSINETKVFNVDPMYDSVGRDQISATLRYVGDHAIFYVEDEWWKSLNLIELPIQKAAISTLLVEFDRIIYPRLTQVYGSEWNPGIDNDQRLKIVITPMVKTTGGYFNSIDEYPKTQISRSNEGEIIYLNSAYLTNSSAKVFLAHEFTHMINFYQKEKLRNVVEDIWLNEARAEYAATLCGYDKVFSGSHLERRVYDFLRAPTDSLTEWTNQTPDYGVVNLFIQYFVARYGELTLTRSMQSAKVGIASLNESLASLGSNDRFEDIFVNWVVANYINDCQLGPGQKFCYLNPLLDASHFRVNPLAQKFLAVREGEEFLFADTIKDWSGRWYEILPLGQGGNLKLTFRGLESGNFQVPIIVFYKNNNRQFRLLKLNSQQAGQDLILDFGDEVVKVALMVVSRLKQSDFSANEENRFFSYAATITSSSSLPVLPEIDSIINSNFNNASTTDYQEKTTLIQKKYSDGSLLRARGQNKVYIITNGYKRWIQSPQIFNAYQHLCWEDVIEVSQEELDAYPESWLIRAEGDFKVYEINGDGTKHWLNMSAEQFSQSGRKWEMVYLVNKAERDWYKIGADVIK